MILTLSIIGVVLSIIPAAMFLSNLRLFREATPTSDDLKNVAVESRISVLIPARDEQDAITNSVSAALASVEVNLEVIVYDDHSTDATAARVQSMARDDNRVRLVTGGPLPDGWNGKQHACMKLASVAKHDRLVFLDADVRLSPDALARLAVRKDATSVDLLSAFPHQQTGTWLETLIIPMMHFILLGFLPLARMRTSTHPSYAAGCGQLFMTDRSQYQAAGTHAAIHSSRHDGLKLPRAYRQAGLSTDVIDGTDLAECRMYNNASQVVRGVLKNAIEGIANPRLIMMFTIMLIGGSVMPIVTLAASMMTGNTAATVFSGVGVVLGHLPRAVAAATFRQPVAGVLFHSLATLGFIGLQWIALVNHWRGKPVAWRGRVSDCTARPR